MVRISRGETVADGLAIEAKAHPLGIVFDPKTREITEAGARGSAVKGGLAGVALKPCGPHEKRLQRRPIVSPVVTEREQFRVGHPLVNLPPVQVLHQEIRMQTFIPADRQAEPKQKLRYEVGSDFFSACSATVSSPPL